MTSIELFSGCGGLAKGLANAGFEHCAFVEFNKLACESLRANFNPALVHEADIKSFYFSTFPSVDLVAGGPPCQPFSLGGLAKAHNDHRDMFPQAVRAIRELQPRAFVFENVKGLLRKSSPIISIIS
jgi:DNA (cytosine-5)-methyltransferase 1